MGADGLAVVVKAATPPGAVPSAGEDGGALFLAEFGQAASGGFVSSGAGEFGEEAQDEDVLLGGEEGLAFAFLGELADGVVPVALVGEGKAVVAKVGLEEVGDAQQVVPHGGGADGGEVVCGGEPGEFFVEQGEVAGLADEGVGEHGNPERVIDVDAGFGGLFFDGVALVGGVAVLVLLGDEVAEHLGGLGGAAVGEGEHVLAGVAVAEGAHAGGVLADGAGVAGGVHALDGTPGVDLAGDVGVGQVGLENTEVFIPPGGEVGFEFIDGTGGAQAGEGGAGGVEGAGPGDGGLLFGGEEKLEARGASSGYVEGDLEGGGGVAAEVGLVVAGVAFDGDGGAFVAVVADEGVAIAGPGGDGGAGGEVDEGAVGEVGVEVKMPIHVNYGLGGGVPLDLEVVFHVAGPVGVLFPVEQAKFDVAEDVEFDGLAGVVGDGDVPDEGVFTGGDEEFEGGLEVAATGDEAGKAGLVLGAPGIELGFDGAPRGGPDGAVGLANINVEAGAIDGEVVLAIAGEAVFERALPPGEAAAGLGDEGVEVAIGEVVDPRLGQAGIGDGDDAAGVFEAVGEGRGHGYSKQACADMTLVANTS